jgi:hypothetical protein
MKKAKDLIREQVEKNETEYLIFYTLGIVQSIADNYKMNSDEKVSEIKEAIEEYDKIISGK